MQNFIISYSLFLVSKKRKTNKYQNLTEHSMVKPHKIFVGRWIKLITHTGYSKHQNIVDNLRQPLPCMSDIVPVPMGEFPNSRLAPQNFLLLDTLQHIVSIDHEPVCPQQ